MIWGRHDMKYLEINFNGNYDIHCFQRISYDSQGSQRTYVISYHFIWFQRFSVIVRDWLLWLNRTYLPHEYTWSPNVYRCQWNPRPHHTVAGCGGALCSSGSVCTLVGNSRIRRKSQFAWWWTEMQLMQALVEPKAATINIELYLKHYK